MIWAGQHVGQAPKLSTDADVILSILLPATTQESQEYWPPALDGLVSLVLMTKIQEESSLILTVIFW